MLGVEDLHAAYGRIPILNGVSFTVEQGEFVGILGHNGMGKTTLLKSLMGFVPTTAGRVSFAGENITRLKPNERVRRGIGYVPQGRQIFPNLSTLDNLRMGFVTRRVRDQEVLEPILDSFPRLKPLLDRRGGDLSGGEQQLLAIARCLCGAPRLVLFDEPTEGIQPSIIDELVDILMRLHTTRALTIVLVEQNLDIIAKLAERVLIIQKGAITRALGPEHIRDPDVVAEFVGMGAAYLGDGS